MASLRGAKMPRVISPENAPRQHSKLPGGTFSRSCAVPTRRGAFTGIIAVPFCEELSSVTHYTPMAARVYPISGIISAVLCWMLEKQTNSAHRFRALSTPSPRRRTRAEGLASKTKSYTCGVVGIDGALPAASEKLAGIQGQVYTVSVDHY